MCDMRRDETSEWSVCQCWRSGRNKTVRSGPCQVFINLPLVPSCPSGWSEEEENKALVHVPDVFTESTKIHNIHPNSHVSLSAYQWGEIAK